MEMPLDSYLSHFSSTSLTSVPELVHLFSSTGEALQIVGILSLDCTMISNVVAEARAPLTWPRQDCVLQFFVCTNS